MPRILVFSTNTISDPGIDLAGSAHLHYSPGVNVITLPCTSGIRPSWILHAFEAGFDGVFIATDGEECAYLHDCAKRSNKIVQTAQEALKERGIRVGPRPRRGDLLGLRRALHQAHDRLRRGAPRDGPGEGQGDRHDADEPAPPATRPPRWTTTCSSSAPASAAWSPRSSSATWATRSCWSRRRPSVGGKMILLSKVFPTLDCASCISTPKMASTIHHPNITPLHLQPGGRDPHRTADGTFRATVTRKARFVDIDACTGCQKCETACTVAVPDQFNADLVARRAAHITFPQAVPKKAVIDRAGSSPCSFACPAGIQAHGYVSLIRSGLDEEAYRLVLDATPLVGTLGRACYAPCEGECTRGSLEGTLPDPPPQALRLRRARRERAPATASSAPSPTASASRSWARARPASPPPGSSPAWATRVKVFEAAPVAGRVPPPRHPVLPPPRGGRRARHRERHRPGRRDRGRAARRGPGRAQGRTASTPCWSRPAPTARTASASRARTAWACSAARTSCARSSSASRSTSRGRRVVVVGGGNVAMDAARTARRLGAASVTVAYRRSRDEMPAHHVEAADAEAGGRRRSACWSPRPRSSATREGAVAGLRCTRDAPGRPGRVRPPRPRSPSRAPRSRSTPTSSSPPSAWRRTRRCSPAGSRC